ncbi:MAG: succinate--CoA ligase subunit alpha [Bacillota bacterium]
MAILVSRNTAVIMQGMTGRQGRYHTARMLEYGTNLVAGVVPGRGGCEVEGLPVYDTVDEAAAAGEIDVSLVLVPPPFALDAVAEAVDAGVSLIVVVTDGVPVLDAVRMLSLVSSAGSRLIGPNSIGVISPGESKVGIMPGNMYRAGVVGVVSRSGTLTHEVSSNLTYNAMGQSTCVGLGGDPVVGSTFVDALEMFASDQKTEAVVLVGEIGGTMEQEAADYLRTGYPKPVVAYIAGQNVPHQRRMGHAGAIVEGETATASVKRAYLKAAGVTVVPVVDDIAGAVRDALSR